MGMGLTSLPKRFLGSVFSFFCFVLFFLLFCFLSLTYFLALVVRLSFSDCGLGGSSAQLSSYLSFLVSPWPFQVPLPHLATVLVSCANQGRFRKALNGFIQEFCVRKNIVNFSQADAQEATIVFFSRQLRTEQRAQRFPKEITALIDEGIISNIKKLDFFYLNV